MSAALKLKIRSKDDKKGSKQKKKKFMGAGLKIIDPDAIQPAGGYQGDSDDNAFETGEFHEADELPQIVDVIDDRPTEIKLLEQFRQTSKWKTVADDEPLESFKTRKSRKSQGGEKRTGNDSDISPPRRKDKKKSSRQSDSDISPPRRNKKYDKGADSDNSPPRHKRGSGRNRSPDASPPRRRKYSSPPSGSKKREKHAKSHSPDLSPPRKKRSKSSGKNTHANDSDLSPPRKLNSKNRSRRVDDDLSPPRRNRRDGNDSDLSPPRVPKPSDAEGRRSTTLDGKKAGLQRASALKDELDAIRRAENKRFDQMDEDVSGRYAKTKVRDRATGKERDFGKELEKEREEERKKAARKEQYDKWSKGLKQVEEQQARVSSAIHEMSKPLARGKDDADLDEHLKNIEREGDPMLKYMAKKKSKASGSGPSKPRYQGPDPGPNRFNVWPGYRWDGVDRSNGYEKDWFEKINSRKALQEESYKWSVEDL